MTDVKTTSENTTAGPQCILARFFIAILQGCDDDMKHDKSKDYRKSRAFLKDQKEKSATFLEDLDSLTTNDDVEGIIRCIGAAAYYGVPAAQLMMVRELIRNCRPELLNDVRAYLTESAASGLPEAQLFLAECYRAGWLFPKNEILAKHLEEMARVRLTK